jgi:hypothetical protein
VTDEKKDYPFTLPEDFAPQQKEARPFASEQLVACEACARANPPTRMNCLYCGAALPATEAGSALQRPVLKQLEDWERGYNVVLTPRRGSETAGAGEIEEAATLLRIDAGLFREILAADIALPLARASTVEEARLIERRLGALGFEVETFSDETLAVEQTPPKRVRKIEFAGEALRGWTVGHEEPQTMGRAEILLFVVGRIFARRIEIEERLGHFKRGSEVAGAREIFTDEAVIDIFTSEGEACGWRITAEKFDYSSLGERKGLLARDNFVLLTKVLREYAPHARLDDEYRRVRQLLNPAWPLAEHTESGGLRRDRPGRMNTEAVTITTNEAQFTRYARLLYQLELRRRSASPDR